MIRHGHRIDLVNERFEAGEMLSICGICRPDGERHAVQGHGIAGAHLLEDPAGPPAGIHEVFRDGLEPVHPRPLPQDDLVVLAAQPDAAAKVTRGITCGIRYLFGRHAREGYLIPLLRLTLAVPPSAPASTGRLQAADSRPGPSK